MRNIYATREKLKYIFLFVSVVLVAMFLYVSKSLVSELEAEERVKMQIWAEATRQLATDNSSNDMGLILKIIQSNTTIPVLIANEKDSILWDLNFDVPSKNELTFLNDNLVRLKRAGNVIEIRVEDKITQYLYYDDSVLLKQLSYYPYIQLMVMILFLILSFLALSSTKNAEQNQVFVGLSKETAHQLGTPISSLMAWMDLLKSQGIDNELLSDMDKDVERLALIAERFSKIGSRPVLVPVELNLFIPETIDYLRKRISNKVTIQCHILEPSLKSNICVSLFEWVIENICKNAIDAMNGIGSIRIDLTADSKYVYIDIKDSGKGISKKHFKTIFNPGYTTKKRGWGLGLTLAKRIIEDYHDGEIYVKDSEIEQGTTFRIKLPRSPKQQDKSLS